MAYERNWSFAFDHPYTPTNALDLTRHQLWALKAMVKGEVGGIVSAGLWTTDYSCDSVTAGTPGDGVDRWGGAVYDGTKIVRGTAAAVRSWHVVKSPAITTPSGTRNFYLLLVFDGSTDAGANIYGSFAGFTGGTTTARPTATDEHLLSSTTGEAWNAGSVSLHRFNICLSTQGDFIWFVSRTGQGVARAELGAMFITPVGTHSGDNYPAYTMKRFLNNNHFVRPADICSSSSAGFPTRNFALQAATFALPYPTGAGAVLNTIPDALTGSQIDLPCWVLVNVTSSSWHARGRLPDMGYIGTDTSGNQYPSGNVVREAGDIKYVSLGCLWIPANVVPNLT